VNCRQNSPDIYPIAMAGVGAVDANGKMMMRSCERGLAVVTGAAGGLGSTFATKLAERGYRLLLIDRRQAQLDEVCQSIADKHTVAVDSCAVDLCQREEVVQLARRLEQREEVELLVNNAGFGTLDYFVDTDAALVAQMIDVHVAAPTILSRAVLPGMIQRNRGNIINMSSVSAFFQSAGNVHYGSTKNYLAMFSLALQQELRGTNVRVQALCPGFVRTDFHAAEGMKGFTLRRSPAHMWMTAEYVVNCALSRLSSRQVIVIPGLGYRLVGRFAQMPLLQPLMRWLTRVPRLPPTPAQPVAPCPAAELVEACVATALADPFVATELAVPCAPAELDIAERAEA
jgi:uncharacterized protein